MKMKIEDMNKPALVKLAKEANIKLPPKSTVPAMRETIMTYFRKGDGRPDVDEKAKDEAINAAKAAKKLARNKRGRAAMARVFDALYALLDEDQVKQDKSRVSAPGITADFWRGGERQPLNGVSIRFTNEPLGAGFERALVSTIKDTFDKLGFDQITIVIRSTGANSTHA